MSLKSGKQIKSMKTGSNKDLQRHWLPGGFVLLVVIVALTYANAFDAVWVYDDKPFITENKNIRMENFTWEEVRQSFNGKGSSIFRPIGFFSFALNHYFHGYDIFGYHLVNIVIHIINTCLVFILLLKTLSLLYPKEASALWLRIASLTAAALWATSPLHIMAVTDIWQRVASLTALFYFAAFLFYIKAREVFNADSTAAARWPARKVWFYALGSIAAYALALLTKENTAVLPAAILAYDLIIFQGGGAAVFKRALKYALPVGIVILCIGFLYRSPASLLDYSWRDFTLVERALTQTRILWFYLSQIFYPVPSRLNMVHEVQVSTSLFLPLTTLFSIAGIAALLISAVVLSKHYKLFSLAVLLFFINHLVESSIIPLELIYEHRNYIPAVFIYLWATAGIAGMVCNSKSQAYKATICVLAAGWVFFQSNITHTRNTLFHDPVLLWTDVTKKSPGLSPAWMNLGIALDKASKNNIPQTIACFETAIKLDNFNNNTQRLIALSNMGGLYNTIGEHEKAAAILTKALEGNREYLQIRNKLIWTRFYQKKYSLAAETIDTAFEHVRGKKSTDSAYLYLFRALLQLKQAAAPELVLASIDQAREIAETNPQLAAGIEAEALRRKGHYSDAIRLYERLLGKSPSNLTAILSLVELYQVTGQADKLAKIVQHYRSVSRGLDLISAYRKKEGAEPYELTDEAIKALTTDS